MARPRVRYTKISESVESLILSMVASCGYPSIESLLTRRRSTTMKNVLEWICDWPPDLFAVTWALLQRTGTYRFTASPPEGIDWPPVPTWDRSLGESAKLWFASHDQERREYGYMVERAMSDLCEVAPVVALEQLQHRRAWKPDSKEWIAIRAILILHAFADEASSALGLVGYGAESSARESPAEAKLSRARSRFRLVANLLLATNGTLSRMPKHLMTVLPKLRTPQRGLSIRTLSHHLCVYAGEVNAIWRTVPFLGLREHSVNILLVPHPLHFSSKCFHVIQNRISGDRTRTDRYFTYRCRDALDVVELMEAVAEAERTIGSLDIIALPESAISENDLQRLYGHLLSKYRGKSRLPAILTGLRSESTTSAETDSAGSPDNQLVFAFFFAGKWYESRQQKHHRWCLDESQIRQYQLAGVLPPTQLWWEGFAVGRRNQSFLLAAPWMCIAPLICEDLAQQDPLADLVRSVGPQLVMALLLDGPQLPERWPGRYASVLADDPGSAVLTLTSAGIAAASRPRAGQRPSKNVSTALWKDAARGWAQVECSTDGLSYHVLTASTRFREEFTVDGRSDHGATPELELDQICRVVPKVTPEGERPSGPYPRSIYARHDAELRKLDLEELTRLVFALDHMVDYPGDASVAAELASGGRAFRATERLEEWTCGAPKVLKEISDKIRERIEKRLTKPAKQAHEDLIYALRTGQQYAESMERSGLAPVLSSAQHWNRLLQSLRLKLSALNTGALTGVAEATEPTTASSEKVDNSAISVQSSREAKTGLQLHPGELERTEWLVAEIFHYLVKMRLAQQRDNGMISGEDHTALHGVESRLQDGALLELPTWDRIVEIFAT